MTDRILDEELSALIDGELSAEREAELRQQLAAEPALAARLAALSGVDASLQRVASVEPSALLKESLRARIDAERPAARTGRRSSVWAGAGLAAAASVALVLLMSSGSGPTPDSLLDSQEDSRALQTALPELENATDEEIGIALDYEILADLDVIEDLELLELMIELEEEPG